MNVTCNIITSNNSRSKNDGIKKSENQIRKTWSKRYIDALGLNGGGW